MPGLDSTILNFDRGIEGIMLGQTAPVRLPNMPQSLPWDGQVEERVAQLLLAPSREEQLLNGLAPENISPSLLSPASFRRLIKRSSNEIKKRSGEHDVFARASAVLDDVESAGELLEAFRNALRQA